MSKSDDMNSLFASTARGLEELLKTELETPGAKECQWFRVVSILRATRGLFTRA